MKQSGHVDPTISLLQQWVRLWSGRYTDKQSPTSCVDVASNTGQFAQDASARSSVLGAMFGRMSGQRGRMNLGMAMKRVLGHNRAPARRGAPQQPRLEHGKLPYSLAPLPRSFPPPWAAQCEFQAARLPASAQCLLARVLTSSSVHSRCRHISPAGGWAGWNIPTHSSFNCHLQPPRSTFLTPSIQQRLAACTLLHPSAIDTRRQQLQLPAPTPSTGTVFLLVLTRLTWPRDWFEHLAERGARESTASTRLRRRP